MSIWLFIFGAAVGSFLNVIALRYDPDKFILHPKIIGGRSHCAHCGKTLRWFELIPLLSFLVQSASCRQCGAPLSLQYPISELLAGLIAVCVPRILFPSPLATYSFNDYLGISAWILIFWVLLVIALIDLRTSLIPDEANLTLAGLGIIALLVKVPAFDEFSGSFIGAFGAIFGLRNNIWLNHAVGAFTGLAIFGLLILITRGRGMGLGDLKLAVALGIVLGWPGVILATALAFIFGGIAGGGLILLHRKKMKSFLPFGPFLAIGAASIFFFGFQIVSFYFALFKL